MADAQTPDGKAAEPPLKRQERIYRWFDVRIGVGSLLHEALDEPIPGGAHWAFARYG